MHTGIFIYFKSYGQIYHNFWGTISKKLCQFFSENFLFGKINKNENINKKKYIYKFKKSQNEREERIIDFKS